MSSWVALVVDLDDFLLRAGRRGPEWASRTTAAVGDLIRMRCAAHPGTEIRTELPDSWIVTLSRPVPDGLAVDAQTLALGIRNHVAARTGTSVSVGVSTVVDDSERAARQARLAMSVKLAGGGGGIYPAVPHRPFDPPEISREVVGLLRAGDFAASVDLVERWLYGVLSRQAAPEIVLGRWLPALVLDVAAAVDPRRNADGSPDWRSTLSHAPVAELADLAALHERSHLHQWLTTCLRRLTAVARADATSPLITRAEELIRDRYSDPGLTLATAASALAVSPYHLAHVFRAERASTFRRQLTGVRVRAAVALLHRGDLGVGQVGERCGFASTRQFRATMRRELDRSPTELLGAQPV